jgi:hypothetical protein
VALSGAGTLTATPRAAEEHSAGGCGPAPDRLERAREESGAERGRPRTRFAVPVGRLDVTPQNPSRILVNRIAAGGTTFQSQTVGLPVRTAGTQDKPMMAIDDVPTSPLPLDGRARITRAVRLTLRRAGRSPSVTALRASAAASSVWLGWDALAGLR